MKKFLPYILILAVILQIFAPFTIGSGVNNNLEIQTNKAEAADGIFGNDLGIEVIPIASVTNNSIEIIVNVKWVTNTYFSNELVIVGIKGPNTGKTEKTSLSPSGELNQSGKVLFTDLQPETTYSVFIKASQKSTSLFAEWIDLVKIVPNTVGGWIGADEWPLVGVLFQDNGSDGEVTNYDNPYEITTLANSDNSTQEVELEKLKNPASYMPDCNILELGRTLPGCIGMGLYNLIFKPSSYLFAKTGILLDFTVGYSLRDQSYRSTFVVEGWGLIRDLCNMFFIFILLYIAIGTILNLNSVKTKEMIINVVIIGLLINFSLFATQVIIDASNILARVFYSTQTIQVGPKINGVIQNETGNSGEIKLSEALVSKINPQNLIINATEINNEKIKGDLGGEEIKGGISAGTFILVVILASIINIVGLVVFLTCSLLFITRVVGLWMAMIFAPLAFFSYTIPRMQEIDMVGWKKWWPETISLAFMAPVFVFFMYLIIKFLETGLGLNDASSSWDVNKIDFILKTFVPFIFIMILLIKAKSQAVKMSGEMGSAVSKIGAAVAGIGLAAATGGAAMAMRGTLGRMGSSVANKKWLANAEAKGGFGGWMAKQTRNAGTGISKSSFDVRATKLGASAAKGLGVEGNIGKAKEGGFAKYKSEQIENRKKRAQELKEATTSKEKDDVLIAQAELDKEKNAPGRQQRIRDIKEGPAGIKFQEGQLAKAERDLKDLVDKGEGASDAADAVRSYRQTILNEITTLKSALKLEEGPIEAAQAKLEDAQNVLINAGRTTLEAYSKSIQSAWGNRINTILSFGQETKAANEQAAREILANLPQERK